jgi:hypothetical protein
MMCTFSFFAYFYWLGGEVGGDTIPNYLTKIYETGINPFSTSAHTRTVQNFPFKGLSL